MLHPACIQLLIEIRLRRLTNLFVSLCLCVNPNHLSTSRNPSG